MRSQLFPALAVVTCAVIGGCASQPPQATAGRCGLTPAFADGGERATLWLRNSSEYRIASEIIYRAAQSALQQGLADPAWTAEPAQSGELSALPPAVVMDIDETVLDNSAPQARMMLEETCFAEFDGVWDAWVAERAAPAIPGAAAFIRAARELKDAAGRPVHIFFITNRECHPRPGNPSGCPQQDDTAANLHALGLDVPTLADDLMLRGEREDWQGEKQTRRLVIAQSYRIVLNVGDDLADFLPDVRRATVTAREQARCASRERWGRQWFMIPNPMYGSWQVALGPDLKAALAAPPEIIEDCDAR